MHILTPQDLTLTIPAADLGFVDTSQLVGGKVGWIGQQQAEKAARFGLSMRQPGYHLLVLGEGGSGRSSLVLQAMQDEAARHPAAADLVYVYNFMAADKPFILRLGSGQGHKLRAGMDEFIRNMAHGITQKFTEEAFRQQCEALKHDEKALAKLRQDCVMPLLAQELESVAGRVTAHVLDTKRFAAHLAALRQDLLENLEVFTLGQAAEAEEAIESLLGRYRVNLVLDNRGMQSAAALQDDDPSFRSLFGSIESQGDSTASSADFMRIRAGKLLQADGGVLMLHLRDILRDHHISEKLHRFLRNGHLQIEELAASSGHTGSIGLEPEAIALQVKIVLIATRDEYYQLHETEAEFASYFRIKVDFADSFAAVPENYRAVAVWVANQCEQLSLPHFAAEAVAELLIHMQREAEDRTRLSARFASLQALMLESAVHSHGLVQATDVHSALLASRERHHAPEIQLQDSIADGELMIRLQGRQIGQINGLSHIDLGDYSFGSPVRISARCYAGDEGIINIDREVEMSGPNHDKGVFILQSWLSASFARMSPLCLSASLVFEQEYHGVEGDSASCAELYALLSALSGLPLPQGIAVTGALNQHGEVMPVGGINDKIEGYFRVCRRIGLDGMQGIVIPGRNSRQLLLDREVISAVEQGLFKIYLIDNVLDGIELLTGIVVGLPDDAGNYRPETVLGRIQHTLEGFRRACDSAARERDHHPL